LQLAYIEKNRYLTLVGKSSQPLDLLFNTCYPQTWQDHQQLCEKDFDFLKRHGLSIMGIDGSVDFFEFQLSFLLDLI
jgi:hypothetical protein